MVLLKTQDLSIYYLSQGQSFKAVDQVSMEIDVNKTYGIVGESGSGKSTLVKGILQLLNPKQTKVEGSIFYQDQDLRVMSQSNLNKLRWQEISLVSQNAMNALSPVHRISHQLIDIYRIHRPQIPKSKIKDSIIEIFELFKLTEQAFESYPHELSGGMLQRVSIASALMLQPKLMILDEATTALDVITQNNILLELKELDKVLANTKLIVTHDLSIVRQFCDHIFIMHQGKVVESGSVSSIFDSPQELYTQELLGNFYKLSRPSGASQ